MNTQSERELIYKSYNQYYYGYHFPTNPTLLELNELYNNIISSKFSNNIKRKLMSKLKFQIRFLDVDDDTKTILKETFQLKLD